MTSKGQKQDDQEQDIRILLADDHAMLCEGLREVLDREPGMHVVGVAADGKRAIDLAREQKPDVVVMDISLPVIRGPDATRAILAYCPDSKVLCLSMYSESRYVLSMLSAGATGYLPKDSAAEELVRAVRTVAEGQTYLSPSIAGHVVAECVARPRRKRLTPLSALSQREQQILAMTVDGLSTHDIAGRLHISVKTVATHRNNMMQKLRTPTIADLVKRMLREGVNLAPD